MSEVESTTDQTESNDPLWQVQLASGQVCRMTLELLDDAFQDGLISENTLIMQDGTSEWVTLRQVAGLDSEDESEAPASSGAEIDLNAAGPASDPATAAQNPAVQAPVAAAPVAVAAPVQPAVRTAPSGYIDPFAPPVPTAQIVPPASAQAAPFVFQGAAQSPSFPPQASYAAPPEPLTRSTAPVAADIDFDIETVNFGKKRSPAKWIVGIAAVLGGLGFAAMNMNSSTEAAIPPAVAAPAAPPAYESTPTPAPAETAAAPKSDPNRLSDDAKRALMEADKGRAAKAAQQRAAQPSRGGGSAPSAGKAKSGPFHKGGDKYDPLNASL